MIPLRQTKKKYVCKNEIKNKIIIELSTIFMEKHNFYFFYYLIVCIEWQSLIAKNPRKKNFSILKYHRF